MANSLKAGMFLIESRMADAAMGDVEALYELGVAYSTGTAGVESTSSKRTNGSTSPRSRAMAAQECRADIAEDDRPRDRRSPTRRPRLAQRNRRQQRRRGARLSVPLRRRPHRRPSRYLANHANIASPSPRSGSALTQSPHGSPPAPSPEPSAHRASAAPYIARSAGPGACGSSLPTTTKCVWSLLTSGKVSAPEALGVLQG